MSDTCMSHIENYWKTLTRTANESFEKGNLEQALLDYTDALFRAEVLNNHQQESLRLDIPFVQVFIISCNNLSATYEDLGNLDEAEKVLIPYKKLKTKRIVAKEKKNRYDDEVG